MSNIIKKIKDRLGNYIFPVTVGSAVSMADGTTAESSLKAVDYGGGAVIPVQAPWTDVTTFFNNWDNYNVKVGASDHANAGYKKHMGLIILKGVISGGTINANILTLPVGYRPLNRKVFVVSMPTSTTSFGRVDVFPNGEVWSLGDKNQYVSLDGIIFLAEQ